MIGIPDEMPGEMLGEAHDDDRVAAFGGTLAEFYDRYLVPLNFVPYAEVVADRAKRFPPAPR
jgi:hypothetical protein